jgi:hypothetical protein
MDEIEERCIIKFLGREGADAHEIQQQLEAVYEDLSCALLTFCESMRNFQSVEQKFTLSSKWEACYR